MSVESVSGRLKTPEEIAETIPPRIEDLTRRYGRSITMVGDDEYRFSTDGRTSVVIRASSYRDGHQSYAFIYEELNCVNNEEAQPLFEGITINGQQLDQVGIAGRFDRILTTLDQAAPPRKEPSPLPSSHSIAA